MCNSLWSPSRPPIWRPRMSVIENLTILHQYALTCFICVGYKQTSEPSLILSQKALGLSENSMLIATCLTVNTPSQLSLDYFCSGVVVGGERKIRERREWRLLYKGTLIPVSPMHSTHLLNSLYPFIPRSSPHLLSGGLESHRRIYWDGRRQSFISCCCEVRIWQESLQGRKGLFHLRVQVPVHRSGEDNVAGTELHPQARAETAVFAPSRAQLITFLPFYSPGHQLRPWHHLLSAGPFDIYQYNQKHHPTADTPQVNLF